VLSGEQRLQNYLIDIKPIQVKFSSNLNRLTSKKSEPLWSNL